MKTGRNKPCPCGSGKKYKKCCARKKKVQLNVNLNKKYADSYNILIKTREEIEGMRRTGLLVIETLDLVEAKIKAGMTTDEINTIVHEFTIENGAIAACLNYRGFPKSVCVSVNEVICHGIPGDRVLKDGDIVNVDVTSILNSYYADANKTFFIGKPDANARKIVSVTRECLNVGMAQVKPGNKIGDIGWAIQQYAENHGCSVVREFVGHGIGLEFHEQPQVPHFGRKGEGVPLVPGMVFTIEPMINLGERHLKILRDNWTAVTRDKSLSAQFEQTVLVTETGCESLTPYNI